MGYGLFPLMVLWLYDEFADGMAALALDADEVGSGAEFAEG